MINSVFPVIAEEIQNNENVAAIVYAPYAGQYDGYATGQVLYGDVTPTGKLTSTWYADMSAFPLLDDYSIPDGTNNTTDLNGIAPRYTVDITQADAAATGLTYQYTNAPVTYDFGYGLSYTEFAYSNLEFSEETDSDEVLLRVSAEIKNVGTRAGKETVQLYISDPVASIAQPDKLLKGFWKIELQPGETRKVSF